LIFPDVLDLPSALRTVLLNSFPRYAHYYRVYGLTLATDLCLSLPRAKESNVIVALSPGREELFCEARKRAPIDASDWIQHAFLDDGALYMKWGRWLEILVSPDGRRIFCNNLSEMPIESYEAYLTNFAVSAALIQQGEETLHATVVEIAGHAIGLLGPSGAGKSTLAAYLINQGGTLVTDDMLRLIFEDGVAFAQPGPRRIKLFKEPAARYLPERIEVGYWNPLGEKMILEPNDSGCCSTAPPLSALYHLEAPSLPFKSDSPVIKKLSGVELLNTILSSSMDMRLRFRARLERQFRFAERIARHIPLFRITYSRSFHFLDEVARRIYESASHCGN
jgi:hypothetical protein